MSLIFGPQEYSFEIPLKTLVWFWLINKTLGTNLWL
jgi:hypothetical protein